jgi:hypothetical protein
MSRHQAVTDPLAGISTGTNGRVDGAGLAAHQHGDVAAADEFATDQPHFGRLGHRVRGLNRRHQTACLDHSKGNAHDFVCHLSSPLEYAPGMR